MATLIGTTIKAKVRQPGERALKLIVREKIGPFLVCRSNSHRCTYTVSVESVDDAGVYTIGCWYSSPATARTACITACAARRDRLAAASN